MFKKMSRLFVAIVVVLTLVFFVLRSPDIPVNQLKQKYANDKSQFVEIENIQVHYRVEGTGPALVLIHGTGASLHTWDGWVDELKDDFTIYRLDLPAFGLTGPTMDRDYSMDNYVEFIHAFTQHVGLDSFAVGGNSLGGSIAWLYTVAHPKRVSQLILVDTGGYPSKKPSTALAFKIARNPILGKLMLHITPKSFIRKNLIQVYGDPTKVKDEVVDRYHDMTLRKGNRHAFIDRTHTKTKNQSAEIKNISCPTLILWGAKDTWILPENAHKFQKDISNSDLIIYPEAGHVPMEEIPIKSANDVKKWLKLEIEKAQEGQVLISE